MSALKLTATASIYVRTATTAGAGAKPPSPFPHLWNRRTRTNSNTTVHHQQLGCRITPYAHMLSPSINLGFSIPLHRNPLSFSSFSLRASQKSGFLGRGYGSPSRSGLVTDAGSESKDRDSSENEVLLHKEETLSPSMQDSPQPSKLLTLPTILTLGRVAAVPLLVATFYMDGLGGTVATTAIFVAAAVTDWLDGYIARKMKLKSSFGAFLDPVADKLMVAATLVLLCTRPLDVAVFGQAPWLLTIPSIAIIGREITMSAVREWAASQDSKLLEAVAVNNLGKWKTASQMTALTILLASRDTSHGGGAIFVGSGVVLLYVSAGLAIWSLVVYMRKIWKVLLR